MTHVSIDDLLQRSGGIYKLVILAAARAKEVAEGSPPLVDTESRKVSSIAIQEILDGKVLYKVEEPAAGAGKRGRTTRAKAKRMAAG